MRLFDMHCDTALSLYETGAPLRHNDLNISLERSFSFGKYVQLTAIYTPSTLTDEDGWEQMYRVYNNLVNECEKNDVPLIRTAEDLTEFDSSAEHTAFILTVEDARILNNKPGRVGELYDLGVRVITPLWGGDTCIGGSHDTEHGLAGFGRDAVREMLRLGIIPDISHASFKSADDIMNICESAGKPPVATHMNSYTVRNHSRNLTDSRFLRLVSLGGIAGVSLCPYHLTDRPKTASSADVLAHIAHYESLAAGYTALGCDYDGTIPPADLSEISALPQMASVMKNSGITDSVINSVFWDAAYNFMKNNLPTRQMQ